MNPAAELLAALTPAHARAAWAESLPQAPDMSLAGSWATFPRPAVLVPTLAALATRALDVLAHVDAYAAAHFGCYRSALTRNERRVEESRLGLSAARRESSEAKLCAATCAAFHLAQELYRGVDRDREANACEVYLQHTGHAYRLATH
jgi:hypothetical protein